MRSVIGFFVGAIFGSLLGASLVLLLTPMSGQEIRTEIQGRAKNIFSPGIDHHGVFGIVKVTLRRRKL